MNLASAFSFWDYSLLPLWCGRLLQLGLNALLASTPLLIIGLLAARRAARYTPAHALLIQQSVLVGVVLCGLLAPVFAGREPGAFTLSLPPSRDMETFARAAGTQPDSRQTAAARGGAVRSQPSATAGQEAGSSRLRVQAEAWSLSETRAVARMPRFAGFLTAGPHEIAWSGMGRAYMAVTGLWLCVTALLLIWLAVCYIGINRLRRQAVPAQSANLQRCLHSVCRTQNIAVPALLVSRGIRSVFLAGLSHPAILLPDSEDALTLPDSEDALTGDDAIHEGDIMGAIMTHEAAHIRAREGWWTLLTRVLCAVFWMQPLLWLLCRQREQTAEEVCDQAVLAQGYAPRAYAHCLITLAERLSPARWEQMAGSGSVVFRSSLSQRVHRILQTVENTPLPMSGARRAMTCAGGTLLAVCLSLLVAAKPVQVDSSLDDDPHLEQRVRIAAQGVPVGDLLALIAQKTGVQIKADGYTTDDKIIVYGPPRPLKAVMADMAALYNDTWLHSESGGQHTYRLTRNPRERDYEDTLAQEMNRRILAQMDAQIKALEETPAQLARRPHGDPIREALADPQTRARTSVLGLLTPAQRLELLDRWQVSLPVSALSPAQKDGIEYLFHGALFDEVNSHPDVVSGEMPALVPIPRDQMDQHDITFTILKGGGGFLGIQLEGPVGFNMSIMNVRTDVRFVLPPHGNPYTGRPVRAAGLPPAQAAREANEGAWPERLETLAEKTGLPIMADYYRSRPILVPAEDETPDAQQPGVQALDVLCRPEGYLWWQRGKTLLLRKRDWYNQQRYEVPDRWVLEQVRRLGQHRGVLTGSDILRLRDLTTNQIVGLNESLDTPSDRRSLAGLRELLDAVAASPFDKDAPLRKGFIGKEVMPHQVAILPDFRDLQQQRLVHNFLAAFSRKISPNRITPGDFGFILQPKTAVNPRSAGADILLYTGKDGMGAGYQVALPLALPDDRRDKTRVEINP